MFDKRNLRKPDNDGECRISLSILKDFGYNDGLIDLLVSSKDTGIVGDEADISRRQRTFGKNSIALPSITSFTDLLAS